MKNHRQRMKTRLSTRTGQKTPEKESKRHPNAKERSESKGQFGTFGMPKCERTIGVQRPIRHFWNAEQHSKRAEFSLVGLWPNGLWVMIRHTIFDIFTKGCIGIQILIVHAYFLEFFGLYK